MDRVETFGAMPPCPGPAGRAADERPLGGSAPMVDDAGMDGAGMDGLGSRPGDASLETRFGTVPFDPDRQIRFRGGLPGFPAVEWFQLDPIPGLTSELMILQAIDAPNVGFITMPLPDEVPVLLDADLADVSRMLEIAPGERLILAIVTLASGRDGIEKYLNLRAPLFIDTRRKVGAQVVLGNPAYPLRYRFETSGN
jgi:flagellar assembly factor FliW